MSTWFYRGDFHWEPVEGFICSAESMLSIGNQIIKIWTYKKPWWNVNDYLKKKIVLPTEIIVSNQIKIGILFTSAQNCLFTTDAKKKINK